MGVGRWSVIEDDPVGRPPPALLGARGPGRAGALRLAALGEAVTWLQTAIGRPYPFGSLGIQMVAPGATDAVLEGPDAHPDRCRGARPAGVRLRLAQPRRPRDGPPVVRRLGVADALGPEVAERGPRDVLPADVGGGHRLRPAEHRGHGCGRSTARARRRATWAGRRTDPGRPRFAYDSTIYDQGALALYALRQEVGPATFRAIETTWLGPIRRRQRLHGRLHRTRVRGGRSGPVGVPGRLAPLGHPAADARSSRLAGPARVIAGAAREWRSVAESSIRRRVAIRRRAAPPACRSRSGSSEIEGHQRQRPAIDDLGRREPVRRAPICQVERLRVGVGGEAQLIEGQRAGRRRPPRPTAPGRQPVPIEAGSTHRSLSWL